MKVYLGKKYVTESGLVVRITFVSRMYDLASGVIVGKSVAYRLDGSPLYGDTGMDLVAVV